jgi:hypothetical protein
LTSCDKQHRIKTILKQHPANWMIWEGQSVQALVDELKTLGVGSLAFNRAAMCRIKVAL